MFENKIVFDYTNQYIKYGYSGYDIPEGEISLNASSPVCNNIIVDQHKMIDIFSDIVDKLNVTPNYMIITDPIYNGEENRKKFAKSLVSKFKLSGVAYCHKHILALYAKSRNRGLVIEFCDNCTNIVPVYDSAVITRGIVICDKRDCLSVNDLADGISRSISQSPIDIRKELYKNMLIIGENSQKIGFIDELIIKLKSMKKYKLVIKISNPNNKKNLPWIGGSIYGSMSACSFAYGI